VKAERQSPALVVYLSALLVVPCGKVPGHAARRHHLAGRKESATVHRLRHGRARQLTRPFEPAAGNRLALAGLLKARMRSDVACRVHRGLLSQPARGLRCHHPHGPRWHRDVPKALRREGCPCAVVRSECSPPCMETVSEAAERNPELPELTPAAQEASRPRRHRHRCSTPSVL
jgi:hypothetical protein